MRCGFILENYRMALGILSEEKINKYCEGDEYTSINMDNEYYIFISNKLDRDELSQLPHLTHINNELLMLVKMDKEKVLDTNK